MGPVGLMSGTGMLAVDLLFVCCGLQGGAWGGVFMAAQLDWDLANLEAGSTTLNSLSAGPCAYQTVISDLLWPAFNFFCQFVLCIGFSVE